MNQSILPPEMTGVMNIVGYRGIGKSWLASQADDPDNVCYLDYEEKAEGIHHQLGFGMYHSVYRDALSNGKTDPVALYNYTSSLITSLPKGRFTVAVLDNISPLELAMKAEVQSNPAKYAKEFALNQNNIQAGRFGGASAVVNFMITSRICMPLYAKGIKLVIATSHVKSKWSTGGPIPNKWNILGADRWQELSILTLILIPGEHAPIPAALVYKEQLGHISFNRELGQFDARRRLPERIPKCTFAEIIRYLREPANLSQPAHGEKASQAEIDKFSEELTSQQLEIVRMALKAQEREEQATLQILSEQDVQVDKEIITRIKELSQNPDNGLIEIMNEINRPVIEGGFGRDFGPGDIQTYMDKGD